MSCPPWSACQGWILASTPSSPFLTVSAGLLAQSLAQFTESFPPSHPEGKTDREWPRRLFSPGSSKRTFSVFSVCQGDCVWTQREARVHNSDNRLLVCFPGVLEYFLCIFSSNTGRHFFVIIQEFDQKAEHSCLKTDNWDQVYFTTSSRSMLWCNTTSYFAFGWF